MEVWTKGFFECEKSKMLNWEERVRVLKNVAAGILYLHDDWEVKVLHRDIKASNVLLDKDMNARLGNFGLARRMIITDKLPALRRYWGLWDIAPKLFSLEKHQHHLMCFVFEYWF